MNVKMVAWRAWHYRVYLIGVFLVLCVVLIFPAVYVDYSDRVTKTHTRESLDELPLRSRNIMVWNPTPINTVAEDTIRHQLGDLLVTMRGVSLTQGIHCGLGYQEGALISGSSGYSGNCYTIFAYPDPDVDQYFTLVEGRMPVHLQPPDQPDNRMGLPDAEAIITQTVAEIAKVGVGQRIVYNTDVTHVRVLEIVGIVAIREPDLPFWRIQPTFKTGVNTPVGDNLRFDFGLMVPFQTFTETIADIAPSGPLYIRELETNLSAIRGDNLSAQAASLRTMERELHQLYLDMEITDNLSPELVAITQEIDDALAPVFWFVVALWALMLAQLFYMTVLALQHQSAEWHILLKEGTSPARLSLIHLGTLAGPVLGAAVVVTLVILTALSVPFPLAIFVGSGLIAILIVMLALYVTFLTWETHLTSRILFRYWIDAGLLVLGAAFLLRLYLVTDKGREIETETFGNFLNLAGILFVIVGGSLLIVRLTTQYARPVLLRRIPVAAAWMTIITLIIGSIGLLSNMNYARSTQDRAMREVGADVRIQVEGSLPDEAWASLPGVRSYEAQLWLEDADQRINVLGVPDLAHYDDGFTSATPEQSGLVLPADTTRLTLQVYALPVDEQRIDVTLGAILRDHAGVPFSATLETADPFNSGSFVSYWVDIPAPTAAPWYLESLSVLSRADDAVRLTHDIYVDELRVETHTGEATLVESFESTNPDTWRYSNPSISFSAFKSTQYASDGEGSLHMKYEVYPYAQGVMPRMPFNAVSPSPVPALLSSSLFEWLNTNGHDLAVGESDTIDLGLPLGDVELAFEVDGVLDRIDGTDKDTRAIIVPYDDLVLVLNRRASLDQFYGANTLFLHLTDREPSSALRRELDAYAPLYAWDIEQALNQQPLEKIAIDMVLIGFGLTFFTSVVIGFYIVKPGGNSQLQRADQLLSRAAA